MCKMFINAEQIQQSRGFFGIKDDGTVCGQDIGKKQHMIFHIPKSLLFEYGDVKKPDDM